MEPGDFNLFSDIRGDPNIAGYLESLVEQGDNQGYSDDGEEEFVELRHDEGGNAEDIPVINLQPHSKSEDEGQHSCNKRRRELVHDERVATYEMLLRKSENGKLLRRTTGEVATAFNISIRSVQRLWKRGRESMNHNVCLNRVKNSGRKRVDFDWQQVRDIPLRKRTTMRNLSKALKVSMRCVSNAMKSGEIRRHSNTIKPILTDANRQRRIEFCLSMVDPHSPPADQSFHDMTNVVHIDEKWFHMTKKTQTYYLLPNEDDPVRKLKSTNFIPKIMFLAAVARPRYAPDGRCTFDGKLGIFPLVYEVCAVRASANRPAGSMEVKAIAKIDRDVIRKFMIDQVLPSIRAKWPVENIGDPIIIQQDNAKTHILLHDEQFLSVAASLGLNVILSCQPLNSPDLNVLDLGFFRAIQSLQEQEYARPVAELVAAVHKSFMEFPAIKSNYIFLTLQSCIVEILKLLGDNTYKIPHMSKKSLERQGLLPLVLPCDSLIIANARAHLLSQPEYMRISTVVCGRQWKGIFGCALEVII